MSGSITDEKVVDIKSAVGFTMLVFSYIVNFYKDENDG